MTIVLQEDFDAIAHAESMAAMVRRREASRAFCPGASPPDNSCSPANKGTGAVSLPSSAVAKIDSMHDVASSSKHEHQAIFSADGKLLHEDVGPMGSPTTPWPHVEIPIALLTGDTPFHQIHTHPGKDEGGGPSPEDWGMLGWGNVLSITAVGAEGSHTISIDKSKSSPSERTPKAIRDKWEQAYESVIAQDGWDAPVNEILRKINDRMASSTPGFSYSFTPRRRGSSRAFCPGVSPPDNSCSPANKGTGKPRPPRAPSPDGKVSAGDTRGSVSGHSRQQREAHAVSIAQWLKDTHGVDMAIDANSYNTGGPPTMDAMRHVAAGIEHLDRNGMTLPKTIVFEDLPGSNAPAGYDYISGRVMFDPDGTQDAVDKSIERGWLAGTSSSEQWGLMVHEMTHHDHREAIRQKIEDRSAITDDDLLTEFTIDRVKTFMGLPDDSGNQRDPWDPRAKFGNSAKLDSQSAKDAAKEVSGYAAYNPLEFVAEVRTGVESGITYSDQVMRLYEDYGGPPVRKRRRSD